MLISQPKHAPWTPQQKRIALTSFLGWSLDAFDFFLMVFMLKDIAHDFGTDIAKVSIAITLTLAARPVGAFLFGRIADRWGRRPALMINISAFSLLEFSCGFAPNLTVLLILRTLYGIAMGGEWGVGAALLMESIPVRSRGLMSGILQSGYSSGYLFASIAFASVYSFLGWRGMFMLGVLPALLVLYIRRKIPESEPWQTARTKPKTGAVNLIKRQWKLVLYTVVLMTAFNFFSHGSQDLYPTFLQVQRQLNHTLVGSIAIIYNIGAIIGAIAFGLLSEHIGRRHTIILAALCALPLVPLWVFSSHLIWLSLGAFFLQFCVQGAWGTVPAHLNELFPGEIRATAPGLVYQIGNLIASINAPMQVSLANYFHGRYDYALALTIGVVAIILIVLAIFGPERRNVEMVI